MVLYILPTLPALAVSIGIEPTEERAHAGPSQSDRTVRSSVIDIQSIAVGIHHITAREDNIVNVTVALIVGFRPKDPRISPQQALCGILELEQRQAQAVQTARRRVPNAVV